MLALLTLSLFWLLLGLIIGTRANAAKLSPAIWKHWPRSWLILPVIGAIAALVGGWIGVLLIGRYFATGAALWAAAIGVLVGSRLIRRLISVRTTHAAT
jgi:hypothetical protein